MAKPWNHPPGKHWNPKLPENKQKEIRERRKNFDDNWDNIFGKKKLNNMEDNDGKERDERSRS
jgi:hypothetical protein